MDEAEKRARGFMLWARVQYTQVEKGRMGLGAFLDMVEFRLAQQFRELPTTAQGTGTDAPRDRTQRD